MKNVLSPLLAIDAHVHLHDVASARQALADAQSRMASARGAHATGVVMLAERSGFDVFEALRAGLVATEESEALWLDDTRRLLVLAGRQIITVEKLEILGLATTARMPDGMPAEQVVQKLDAADALVILPWGVGKWIGKRGKLIDRLLSAARPGRLFLGDNGGRPHFWKVAQFSSGLPVLPGTDPLPLAGWSKAIGTFGSIVHGTLPAERPSMALKKLLRDPDTRIERYGKLAHPLNFVADQVRLRLARGAEIR